MPRKASSTAEIMSTPRVIFRVAVNTDFGTIEVSTTSVVLLIKRLAATTIMATNASIPNVSNDLDRTFLSKKFQIPKIETIANTATLMINAPEARLRIDFISIYITATITISARKF